MTCTGLFWFNHDLRLHDQPALWQLNNVDRLICVFCFDRAWQRPNDFNSKALGLNRQRFLQQALADLNQRLQKVDQQLLVVTGEPVAELASLIERYSVDIVARSEHNGIYENRQWQLLQQMLPDVSFTTTASHTLFCADDLPFPLPHLPATFSQFRKQVETLSPSRPMTSIGQLPAPPVDLPIGDFVSLPAATEGELNGGETPALVHLDAYFNSSQPAHYKTVRNALDGWDHSTKFSAWLAQGSLSCRTLVSRLQTYEKNVTANESTYWIYFELLWREYFQWYAHCHKEKLFKADGIRGRPRRRCYYPERYQKWCHGNTPYPLVNACMHQLNETGYLSNRGRLIAASCFVNELGLDWRFGAAFFEQQLIDYDMASNWGNWQYIAGVGADPRGGRHFNLDKQTRLFDPDGEYIRRYDGERGDWGSLDSVDAADWPIMPDK